MHMQPLTYKPASFPVMGKDSHYSRQPLKSRTIYSLHFHEIRITSIKNIFRVIIMKANPLLMDKSNPGKMTKGVILVINKGIMPLLKRVSRSLKTGKNCKEEPGPDLDTARVYNLYGDIDGLSGTESIEGNRSIVRGTFSVLLCPFRNHCQCCRRSEDSA